MTNSGPRAWRIYLIRLTLFFFKKKIKLHLGGLKYFKLWERQQAVCSLLIEQGERKFPLFQSPV